MAACRPHRCRSACPSLPCTGSGQTMPRRGQMLHQPEEPGQLRRVYPLLVQRQDVVARGGAQRVVGVLHPLGDAAERDHGAQVVFRQERRQGVVGDLGIDRHVRLGPPMRRTGRMTRGPRRGPSRIARSCRRSPAPTKAAARRGSWVPACAGRTGDSRPLFTGWRLVVGATHAPQFCETSDCQGGDASRRCSG